MVGVALFGHEDSIHAQGHISKDGVGKIVDAVGVSGIVGIGNGQVGFQSLIPSRRIRQAHFDLKLEFVEIVIIVRGRDGKRDGLYSRQGGLKHHVPGRFVPVIHFGHIKQIERHDADCPRRLTACPFYSVSGHGPRPLFGVHLGRRRIHPRFAHSHECGLAKNRAPFHLAVLFQMGQHPGLQQVGGRVHQGIALHGGLAKNRSPYLIRRDEPPLGALPSNAILRPGVILFDHELLHDFAVRFLHHSLPKQVARRDRLFLNHDLFQFHVALLGLETDPSIRPYAEFSSHERDVELNDNGMRIRRDHAISLSLIWGGHGQ